MWLMSTPNSSLPDAGFFFGLPAHQVSKCAEMGFCRPKHCACWRGCFNAQGNGVVPR